MDLLPPLCVAIPFMVAVVLMAFPRTTSRTVVDLAALATAGLVGGLAVWMLASYPHPLVHWFGGWTPREGMAVGINFLADLVGAGLTGFAALIVCAALLTSWRYFDTVGALYHVLTLILLGAVAGFCLTGDLFNLFVFYELVGVSAYALTAYKMEEAGPLQGSMNFAVVVTLGGSFLLAGLALLYGRTGVLNMVEMGRILAEAPPDGLVLVAFVLVSAGLMIKSAILPFHFAHADAHAVAPVPILVIFSGILLYLGIYGMARVFWTVFAGVFAPVIDLLVPVLLWAGVATALVGGCMAVLQSHLKRLLAFVSISHSGLMLAGIALFEASGLAGTFLYLVSHGSILAALFCLVGVLFDRFSEVHEHRLFGKARTLRGPGLMFVLSALAIAGTPPFGTFVGKALIEEAAAAAGYAWLSFVFVAASALTAGALLRVAARVFLGWGDVPRWEEREEEKEGQPEKPKSETEGARRLPSVMIAPGVCLLGLALALGIFRLPAEALRASAEAFQDSAFYYDALFEPHRTAAPSLEPVPLKTASALKFSGFTVCLSVLLAGLGLFSGKAPAAVKRAAAVSAAPLHVLRHWHSGHIGDYVLWMTLGIAAFGTAVLAVLGFA